MLSQDLTGKENISSTLKAFCAAMKQFAFNFRPLFSILLFASALTFGIFAVFNSHVTMHYVGITEVVQTEVDKQTSEYLRFVSQNISTDPTDNPEPPLLTLFTTFKNRRDRWRIHWNVLKNWSLFQPKVRVILFNDRTDESLIHFAKELNWTVLSVPAKSVYGTPMLKQMFFTCQKHVPESLFYGYANGDILFDAGLTDTLQLVGSYLDQLSQSLIIGRRTNFKVRGRRITSLQQVHKLAKTEGKLFRSDAEDYFLLAHNAFPWKAVPNIVIGRPAYDNFLVATARKYGVAVIDATRTLVALHQTGIDGDFAGHRNRDAHYNSRVIGRFDYSKGLTGTSQYLTDYTPDGRVELWTRPGYGGPALLLTPAVPVTAPNNSSRPLLPQVTHPLMNATLGNGTTGNWAKEGTAKVDIAPGNGTREPADGLIRVNVTEGLDSNETVTGSAVQDLLTLFTVFNSNEVLRDVHLNVIKNWAFYHPNVATVLFTDSKDVLVDQSARAFNWTVLPRVQQKGKVLPLKKMFLQVQNIFPNSKFYGYINGDLVFGEGLIKTVSTVYRTLEDLDNALVLGIKNRYIVNEGQKLFEPSEVNNIIKTKSSHLQPDFDENFLLAHSQFPWQHIPDLVIGRSVYDNYLVALALRHEFAVIDSTRTLIALDQMTSDVTLMQSELEDFDPNLLGALDYTKGFASSAQYETSYDEWGNVHLWQRQKDGQKPILLSYHRK